MSEERPQSLRQRIWEIIFLADTRAGRAFDVALLWLIGLSVLAIMLETVHSFERRWGYQLRVVEIIFTAIFTVEYLLRIWVSRKPIRYIFSFFGIVDLLSIIPTWLTFFIPGSQSFAVIRVLRILRMFRVLKMARHMGEARILTNALHSSRPKITVFLFGVLSLVIIMGTLMYLIEGGQENGQFESIPASIYWAVVTVTTVGYGDMVPSTLVGQFFSACMMITGYAIIAVPTGIVGAELAHELRVGKRECHECGIAGHLESANYCRNCGAKLPREES